jgi:hypothetical protein
VKKRLPSHPIGYPTLVDSISDLVDSISDPTCQFTSLPSVYSEPDDSAKVKAHLKLFWYLGRGDPQLLGTMIYILKLSPPGFIIPIQ